MTVLQSWIETMPIRMQSTLLLSLRGPDTHAAPHIKEIQRWMRGLVFKPGNPENIREFMHHSPPQIIEKGSVAKELEFCTQHFYSHLMHGLEVIAYRYPIPKIAVKADVLFQQMCNLLHLPFESRSHFEERLAHLDWPDGKQPENFEEAIASMNDAEDDAE